MVITEVQESEGLTLKFGQQDLQSGTYYACSGLHSNSNSFLYGCDGPQPQLGFISIDLTALNYKVDHAKNINPPRI